jgi:hypothetical protein
MCGTAWPSGCSTWSGSTPSASGLGSESSLGMDDRREKFKLGAAAITLGGAWLGRAATNQQHAVLLGAGCDCPMGVPSGPHAQGWSSPVALKVMLSASTV